MSKYTTTIFENDSTSIAMDNTGGPDAGGLEFVRFEIHQDGIGVDSHCEVVLDDASVGTLITWLQARRAEMKERQA